MKDSDNNLPDWLQWLLGGIGMVGVMVLVGGPAIAFFSVSWPLILLLLLWGGAQWAWELWQDNHAYKKELRQSSSWEGGQTEKDSTNSGDNSDISS